MAARAAAVGLAGGWAAARAEAKEAARARVVAATARVVAATVAPAAATAAAPAGRTDKLCMRTLCSDYPRTWNHTTGSILCC